MATWPERKRYEATGFTLEPIDPPRINPANASWWANGRGLYVAGGLEHVEGEGPMLHISISKAVKSPTPSEIWAVATAMYPAGATFELERLPGSNVVHLWAKQEATDDR